LFPNIYAISCIFVAVSNDHDAPEEQQTDSQKMDFFLPFRCFCRRRRVGFGCFLLFIYYFVKHPNSNDMKQCFQILLSVPSAFSSISFFHDLIFCIRYDAKLCYLRIQMWQEHSLDMFTDMELTLCCLVEDQEMAFPGDSQIVLSIIINLKWKCVSRQVLLYLTSLSIVRCCSLKKSVLLGIVMRR
jgi:hypothetical protein